MAIASGLGSSLGVGVETTAGTAVSLTRWLEYNSESLHLEKNVVQGAGLRGSGLFARAARRAYTTRTATGTVEMDCATRGLGPILQQIMGGTSTSTLISGSSYQQVHQPGSMVNRSLTVQKLVPNAAGTLVPFTYRGAKITDYEFSCEVGGILTLSVTFDAWDESTATAAGTPSYTSTDVFHFAQGTLKLGGTASTASNVVSVSGGTTVASVKGITVSGSNPLATDRYFLGSNGIKAEQLENDWRTVGGSMDAEFVSQAALYDAFAADTAMSLQLSFVGTTAISGANYPTMEITIPSIRLEGSATPQVGGPDVIDMSVDFTGLDDGTNAAWQIRTVTADTAL